MRRFATLFVLLSIASGTAAAQTLCPDGTYVDRGPCQLCPNGKYIGGGGRCALAPDGSYVRGNSEPSKVEPRTAPIRNDGPRLAPDGSYVGGGRGPTMCPDGSYVAASRCVLAPNGKYVGKD